MVFTRTCFCLSLHEDGKLLKSQRFSARIRLEPLDIKANQQTRFTIRSTPLSKESLSAWIVRAGREGVKAPNGSIGGYGAIYWSPNGAGISALSEDRAKALHQIQPPDASRQIVAASAGMIFRFSSEITKGSTVVIRDPATRLYHFGKVSGLCMLSSPIEPDDDGAYRRAVSWEFTVLCDALSAHAKHSLDSTSTLFAISADALRDRAKASSDTHPAAEEEQEWENSSEIREATAKDGIERIKDRVVAI